MNKNCIYIFLLVALLISGCEKSARESKSGIIKLKDDKGIVLTFSSTPERIVSLAPSITEMIYSLGAGDKIAGNTLYCTYPVEAKSKPKVGDLINADYEKILSLKPDLVIVSIEGNVKETYERLLSLGLKVMVTNPRDFDGIKKTYADLGKVLNSVRQSDSTITSWNKRFKAVAQKIEHSPRHSGMFIVGLNPIMLAGKNTFINEIITAAGIQNIAADQPFNYPLFSREEILKRDPEFIITTGHASGDVNGIKTNYKEWRDVKAVKNNHIIVVDEDRFLRPGPRFIDAVEDLVLQLQNK